MTVLLLTSNLIMMIDFLLHEYALIMVGLFMGPRVYVYLYICPSVCSLRLQ